ncbi:MAG: DNA polymerase III subunit gamma/tau [Dehalococcoidales bacterium]|nr:DNA polymerase III subunit gamma/tau [Dehalococcoidales bacterium]
MASQVFYRKWRPQLLAEVVGQEHVTRTLLNALANERVSHAYLFCGPRGTGKTSTARGLAKAVNCLENGKGEPCNTCDMCQAITEGRALDVIEVDAASNRGIDEIRNLREKVNYAPNQARRKVYIIDEVHMLTKEASNALLKTLEEPPSHVIFILATTEAHKLLPTILSRCQRFDFHRLSQADMLPRLSHICENEGITIGPEALRLISRAATGSLRDAENLLQQMMTYYGNEISLQQAQTLLGISGDQRAGELVKDIVNKDIAAGVATINNVNNDGLDLRQFNRDVVEYLRVLLLVKTGSSESIELTAEDIKELKELATRAPLAQILKAIKHFGQLDLGLDNYSTLPLELALVDCTLPAAEEKEESIRQPEPEPAAKKTPPKATPPPPEPEVAQPEEKKEPEPEPEPAVAEPVAKEEPVPSKKLEPSTAATDVSPTADSGTIEQLQSQWSKIINEAPEGMGKTPAAALLRSARPKEINDDIIVLSFKYPLHKENMEKLDNQKIAEKIVSSFLGRSCKVRCVYEHENNHLVKAALNMGAQHDNGEES